MKLVGNCYDALGHSIIKTLCGSESRISKCSHAKASSPDLTCCSESRIEVLTCKGQLTGPDVLQLITDLEVLTCEGQLTRLDVRQ